MASREIREIVLLVVISHLAEVLQMNASQKTIDANYTAFRKVLPEIMQRQAGRFALMRNEQIVDFFDTARDAVTAGGHLYEDGEFSVQEVMRAPINLG